MFKEAREFIHIYHERAAIYEYDGGLARGEANRRSLNETYEELKILRPDISMATFTSSIVADLHKNLGDDL